MKEDDKNKLCLKCTKKCKQLTTVVIIECPKFEQVKNKDVKE